MKIFAGVDPGATGAIGFLDGEGRYVGVIDWPGDEVALVRALREELDLMGAPVVCMVEQQQAMGMGAGQAMLKLGRNYGVWLGVLAALGVPVQQIRPCDWKKGLVPPKAKKDADLAVARRMWPGAPLGLAKHDGRADALLLAYVAWQKNGRRG